MCVCVCVSVSVYEELAVLNGRGACWLLAGLPLLRMLTNTIS